MATRRDCAEPRLTWPKPHAAWRCGELQRTRRGDTNLFNLQPHSAYLNLFAWQAATAKRGHGTAGKWQVASGSGKGQGAAYKVVAEAMMGAEWRQSNAKNYARRRKETEERKLWRQQGNRERERKGKRKSKRTRGGRERSNGRTKDETLAQVLLQVVSESCHALF